MSPTKQTALITGASGGIGHELSKLFAADGYNLVLLARSQQKLEEIAQELAQAHNVSVTVLVQDLSDPAAADQVFAALQARSLAVDILVNNAGFGVHGQFAQTDWAEELGMLQVNVMTLTRLTKLFLPGMIERKFGRILNVGSTGSFSPGPLMAIYCATKAYVLSFSEAIGEELKGTGVSVTALCPGVTRTGFQARAKAENIRLVRSGAMGAEQVAKIGYQAMHKGQRIVIPGLWNKLLIFSMRFAPRSLATGVAGKMME